MRKHKGNEPRLPSTTSADLATLKSFLKLGARIGCFQSVLVHKADHLDLSRVKVRDSYQFKAFTQLRKD